MKISCRIFRPCIYSDICLVFFLVSMGIFFYYNQIFIYTSILNFTNICWILKTQKFHLVLTDFHPEYLANPEWIKQHLPFVRYHAINLISPNMLTCTHILICASLWEIFVWNIHDIRDTGTFISAKLTIFVIYSDRSL